MTIPLTREQQHWIDEAVAAGRFASAEDAIQYAVGAMMLIEASIAGDDLAWAKPLVDAGLRSLKIDGGIPAFEVFRETRALIEKHGR